MRTHLFCIRLLYLIVIYGIQAACIIVLSDGCIKYDHKSYAEINLSGNHVLIQIAVQLQLGICVGYQETTHIVYSRLVCTNFIQSFWFGKTFQLELLRKQTLTALPQQALVPEPDVLRNKTPNKSICMVSLR